MTKAASTNPLGATDFQTPVRGPAARSTTVVLVVNYCTPQRVLTLLDSVRSLRVPPMGVVVVDNASGDNSVEALRGFVAQHDLGSWVHVHAADRNTGFAGGNNLAIQSARYLWPHAANWLLLNPDTVVHEHAVSALERHFEACPRAGIVGSQITDAEGESATSGHIGDGPLAQCAAVANLRVVDRALACRFRRLTACETPTRCDWVSGAALMIRAAVMNEVGMLDAGFFLYFEEADLCKRVRRAGWQVWLVPESRVTHFEGSSTGIRHGRRPAYWFASRRRYFNKHFGTLGCLSADAAWCIGRALHVATKLVRGRRPNALPPRFTLDLLLGDLRAIWSVPTRDRAASEGKRGACTELAKDGRRE